MANTPYRRIVVKWDTTTDEHPEGDPAAVVPAAVSVPRPVADEDIADWLSDTYGWLVLGWTDAPGGGENG